MVKGGDIGMPLARKSPLVSVRKPELLQKSERIAVPCRQIDLRAELMMIEFGEKPHEIMGDGASGGSRTDDRHLRRVERCNLIGRIAAERQPVRRIGFGHRQIGQIDLVERAIFHRPEDIAPCRIEPDDAGVALGQPDPEPR